MILGPFGIIVWKCLPGWDLWRFGCPDTKISDLRVKVSYKAWVQLLGFRGSGFGLQVSGFIGLGFSSGSKAGFRDIKCV